MDLDNLLAAAGPPHDWSDRFDPPFPARILFLPLAGELPADRLQTLAQGLAAEERPRWRELSAQAVPRRCQEWLLGRLLAKRALRQLLLDQGEAAPDWHDIALRPDTYGKPEVLIQGRTGRAGVSISHSRQVLAAMAALGQSRVGIDLEPLDRIQSDCRAFARHTLSEREQQLLGDGGDCRRRLLDFWVAKEAAAKAVGTGFQGQPKAFELEGLPSDGQVAVLHAGCVVTVQLRELEGHLAGLACYD